MNPLSPQELAIYKHRMQLAELRSEHVIVNRHNTPEPRRWSDFHTRLLLVCASTLPTDTEIDIINLTQNTFNK